MDNFLCINCGISTFHLRRHYLDGEAVLSIVRQWISPQTGTASDHVCKACWTIINQDLPGPSRSATQENSTVGHRHVCVCCGRSLLRIRDHRLRNNHSDRESHIYDVISEWIHPQQIRETSCICHPCWQRANRVPRRTEPRHSASTLSPENEPRQPESMRTAPNEIILPDYKRAVATEQHCFVLRCQGSERLVIPLRLRVTLKKIQLL